jgi:Ca-activated chloride channel family protein
MRLFLGAVLALALGTSAVAQDRAMIVLDASGSMWGQIDGKTKIEIARETMGEVLGVVPEAN